MKSKRTNTHEQKENETMVHMSFYVEEKLRNKFKGKIANEGKKLKEVMAQLMEEYLKERR